jgi:hypothetical protein
MTIDYVFDGSKPPYATTDAPNPLNLYGKTKLAGEVATLTALPSAGVLRVPVLYGCIQELGESAVSVIAKGVTDTSKPSIQDHWAYRYVVSFLLVTTFDTLTYVSWHHVTDEQIDSQPIVMMWLICVVKWQRNDYHHRLLYMVSIILLVRIDTPNTPWLP